MATHSSVLANTVFLSMGNPMDRGALWSTVHGVTKSQMTEQLSRHFLH